MVRWQVFIPMFPRQLARYKMAGKQFDRIKCIVYPVISCRVGWNKTFRVQAGTKAFTTKTRRTRRKAKTVNSAITIVDKGYI